MNIRKLEIKKELINKDSMKLKMLVYMFNKRKSFFHEKKVKDTSHYFDSIINEDKNYHILLDEYNKKKGWSITITDFKNKDLYNIVISSEYEPFDFHFIKDFFSKVFYNSDILNNFIFKRKRKSLGWIYRKPLYSFLDLFTNIDDVCRDFLEYIDKNKKIELIDNYFKSQYFKFIFQYIKKNKKKFLKYDINFELISIDNSFLIIQKEKIIISLNYSKTIYYKTSFTEWTTLFS